MTLSRHDAAYRLVALAGSLAAVTLTVACSSLPGGGGEPDGSRRSATASPASGERTSPVGEIVGRGPAETREALGRRYLESQNYALAETVLESVLELEPGRYGTLMALGVLHDVQERHGEAQARFEQAADVAPELPEPVNNLGYSYYLEGRFDDAEAAFRRALEIDPDFVRARSNLALTQAVAGDRSAALASFERVGGRHQALNNLGYLELLLEETDGARSALTESLDETAAYYGPARRNLARLDAGEANRAVLDDRDRLGLNDLRARGTTVPDTPPEAEDPLIAGPATRSGPSTGETPALQPSILLDADEGDVADVAPAAPPPEPESPADDENDGDGDGETDGTDVAGETDGADGADGADADDGTVEIDPLTPAVVEEVQLALADRGFDVGPADGRLGPRTTTALRLYQIARRMPVNGIVSERLLRELEIR